MPRAFLTLLSLLILAQGAMAESPRWTFEIEPGAQSIWWFSSDDDDGSENVGHAIDYTVEGAKSTFVSGVLRSGREEFLGFRLVRPFEESDLAETYIGEVVLDLHPLFSYEIEENPNISIHLRLDHRRSRISGMGTAMETMVFGSSTMGEVGLDVGDSFRFESTLADWYFTFVSIGTSEGNHARIGLFRSEVEKPHEAFVPNNYVIETTLRAKGVFVELAGTSWDFLLRYGSVEFEPRGTLSQPAFMGTGSHSFQMGFRAAPAITIVGGDDRISDALPRVALVPHLGGLFKIDYLNPFDGPVGSAEGELSMDIVLEGRIGLVWRF